MKGKVYFSDGTTKPIVDYAIYSDHDVEFWTEDGHYRYYSCILEDEVYTGTVPKTIYKHRVHHFYKIELLSGKYEELEIAVKQLTGYNFECLYKLFCMGWTLTEPETPVPMNQLLDLIEEV